MRVTSRDRDFGFELTPTKTQGYFVLRLVIGGSEVGAHEPCLLGNAMRELQNLRQLDDPRLATATLSAADTLGVLRSDDQLNDGSLMQLAESFDRTGVRGYRTSNGDVVLLAIVPAVDGTADARVVRSMLAGHEFDSLVEQLVRVWSEQK